MTSLPDHTCPKITNKINWNKNRISYFIHCENGKYAAGSKYGNFVPNQNVIKILYVGKYSSCRGGIVNNK